MALTNLVTKFRKNSTTAQLNKQIANYPDLH